MTSTTATATATATISHPATGGLTFGSVRSSLPVVLAPMAGVTNAAYRQVCREQAEAGVADVVGDTASPTVWHDPARPSDGLFVCEMVTSRGIVERDPKSLAMLSFDPGERTRSVQLYGVDPATMAEATRIICGEFGVDHVDLNFGCPVPKVTRAAVVQSFPTSGICWARSSGRLSVLRRRSVRRSP